MVHTQYVRCRYMTPQQPYRLHHHRRKTMFHEKETDYLYKRPGYIYLMLFLFFHPLVRGTRHSLRIKSLFAILSMQMYKQNSISPKKSTVFFQKIFHPPLHITKFSYLCFWVVEILPKRHIGFLKKRYAHLASENLGNFHVSAGILA